MSALTPHIRAIRALADSAAEMGAGQSNRWGDLFNETAWALRRAADKLEAEERELTQRLDGAPSSVHYDPKGRPPRASER